MLRVREFESPAAGDRDSLARDLLAKYESECQGPGSDQYSGTVPVCPDRRAESVRVTVT